MQIRQKALVEHHERKRHKARRDECDRDTPENLSHRRHLELLADIAHQDYGHRKSKSRSKTGKELDRESRSRIKEGVRNLERAARHKKAEKMTPQDTAALNTAREALASLAGSLTITSADVLEVLNSLPDGLDPLRREAVKTALSLVGKVNYFWGGCALFLDNLRRNTQ